MQELLQFFPIQLAHVELIAEPGDVAVVALVRGGNQQQTLGLQHTLESGDQLLLGRKKVENWIVWIVVDVLYVGLYVYKGLNLTAFLYALFVVLAYTGLRAWSNIARRDA